MEERKELMKKSLEDFKGLEPDVQLTEYAQAICSRVCMEQGVEFGFCEKKENKDGVSE